MTDRVKEGNWKWVTDEPVTYTNWAPGEPSNSYSQGEHYAMFYSGFSDGTWNDGGLDSGVFLCEWE